MKFTETADKKNFHSKITEIYRYCHFLRDDLQADSKNP